MNRIKGITLLLLTLTLYMVVALNGAVGCMDNSRHLRQSFDTKAYHYVQCDCPCRSKSPGTNRCARCGHVMVPQEEEYITNIDGAGLKKSHINPLMQNPDQKLKELILKYRKKQ